MVNDRPVILVHGLLGFGPQELGLLKYWRHALAVPSPLTRFEATVCPLGSAHDTACELAAQIKGKRVDYGDLHATTEGHERLGKDYADKGLVPQWDASHPVHLVGHGLGAATIRCLQHLLELDYWGWGSDHTWVSSISTVSGSLNGSTLVYLFGANEQTGLLESDFVKNVLRMFEVFTAATGGVFESIYDLDLEHWGFERRGDESLLKYLNRVADSEFFKGKDNAFYSLSLQGALDDNNSWPTFPATFYFSYIAEQTYKGWLTDYQYPNLTMNPGLMAVATFMGRKEFETDPILPGTFKSSDWWENDGAVPTYSQKYPHTAGAHPVGLEFTDSTAIASLVPGSWHYMWLPDIDHLDLTAFPQLFKVGTYKRFYWNLFQRLGELNIGLAPPTRLKAEEPVLAR